VSLEGAQRQWGQLTTLDGVTGLYSRHYFNQQIALLWQLSRRDHQSMALFLVELDHFKPYTRHYGEEAGLELLRQVAGTLRATFQRGSDFVARYDDNKFAIVAVNINYTRAGEFAGDLCQRVRQLQIPHRVSPVGELTTSVGYQVLGAELGNSVDQLIMNTETALYRARWQGGNRVEAGMELGGGITTSLSVG
jgi:diguanylate cyclase (GGDEF)-like protein